MNNILKIISSSCLLCYDAKCDKSCPNSFKPSNMLRSLRFNNELGALKDIKKDICLKCEGYCENNCIHFDKKVRIHDAIKLIKEEDINVSDISLETTFLNVKCENPFFLSSSIVTATYEMCKRALEMGFAGVVTKTISFYNSKEVSPRFSTINDYNNSFIGFKNLEQLSEYSVEYNLDIIKKLKKEFPNKVIIASIMGQEEEEWTKLASLVTDAGADLIECNFSCPQMAKEGLGSDVGCNEALVKKFTKATVKGTKLPVIAKMTPNITNIKLPGIASYEAGAKGISAINTIKCLTNINLDTMVGDPDVSNKTAISGYSGRAVKPIALRFIKDLSEIYGVELSGIGGIESYYDALEYISLGCRIVQLTTSAMEYGYRIIDDLILGTKLFLKKHNYKSINDIFSLAKDNIIPASDLDRESIIYPIIDYDKCISCKRCYISCRDGGHQAIYLDNDKVKIDAKKCVGCHLCYLVCPINAINKTKRINKK